MKLRTTSLSSRRVIIETLLFCIFLHVVCALSLAQQKMREQTTCSLAQSNFPTTVIDEQASSLQLIQSNFDLLAQSLKGVIRQRRASPPNDQSPPYEEIYSLQRKNSTTRLQLTDEVVETISICPSAASYTEASKQADEIALDPKVSDQLLQYVTSVASTYRPNQYHNFAHATDVVITMSDLLTHLGRVPQHHDGEDPTFGLASDALVHFACLFSALIHDVDHAGIPNSAYIKEDCDVCSLYDNRSILEKKSFDIAWFMLMEDDFVDLRSAIYTTHGELHRFRQLVVNMVMATDIADKEYQQERQERWEKAFASNDSDRKATAVIEHLMQVADVGNSVQPFASFYEWNRKLLLENRDAFHSGRVDGMSAEAWYKGTTGFLKGYVVPLAAKIRDSGVFGDSSGTYLELAESNTQEWESSGREMAEVMCREADDS